MKKNRSKLNSFFENLVGWILFHLGLFYLLRLYNNRKKLVPILMYHSILSKGNRKKIDALSLGDIGMIVGESSFERHLTLLKNKYNVISLSEFLRKVHSRGDIPKNSIVLTFDDGFFDNYSTAYNILKRFGMSATIFIVGDTLKKKGLLWLHEFYLLLDAIDWNGNTIKHIEIEGNKISVQSKNDCFKRGGLKDVVQKSGYSKQKEIFREIKRAFNLTIEENAEYYLSEKEIVEMSSGNIEFGAHSMTHRNLALLSKEDCNWEIVESRRVVEEITNKKEIPFAYPFGHREAFNLAVVNSIKKNNMSCGLTTIEGLNRTGSDTYLLNRIEINDISVYSFVYRVTGLRGTIKEICKRLFVSLGLR